MTTSEALFFVGKCLTLGHCPDKIEEVRVAIRNGLVEWEKIVWISTGAFVFPALYLQFKWAGLLDELPSDLAAYMDEVTRLNCERNLKIIDQAHEINALLNKHGISPVFLKGTAHLLDGLYGDIAERMVGDIDLLVDGNKMVRAAEILISKGYQPLAVYNPKDLKMTKHYPRLTNKSREAAVEIHRELLPYPYNKKFSCEAILRSGMRFSNLSPLCVFNNENQIIHNILNVQVNDMGYYYAGIFLRQSYDLFLLSQRENPLKVVKEFGRFFHQMNGNLAVTKMLLDYPGIITFEPTWQSRMFVKRIMRNINHPGWERLSHFILYLIIRFSNYAHLLGQITHNKDLRSSLYTRMCNPKWYGDHLRSYRTIY